MEQGSWEAGIAELVRTVLTYNEIQRRRAVFVYLQDSGVLFLLKQQLEYNKITALLLWRTVRLGPLLQQPTYKVNLLS
jgi:hypothetical protein